MDMGLSFGSEFERHSRMNVFRTNVRFRFDQWFSCGFNPLTQQRYGTIGEMLYRYFSIHIYPQSGKKL
jgi:hypothetical protein